MRHPGFLQFYILYWAHFHLKKTITRVEDEIRFLYQSILESLNITLYNTYFTIYKNCQKNNFSYVSSPLKMEKIAKNSACWLIGERLIEKIPYTYSAKTLSKKKFCIKLEVIHNIMYREKCRIAYKLSLHDGNIFVERTLLSVCTIIT